MVVRANNVAYGEKACEYRQPGQDRQGRARSWADLASASTTPGPLQGVPRPREDEVHPKLKVLRSAAGVGHRRFQTGHPLSTPTDIGHSRVGRRLPAPSRIPSPRACSRRRSAWATSRSFQRRYILQEFTLIRKGLPDRRHRLCSPPTRTLGTACTTSRPRWWKKPARADRPRLRTIVELLPSDPEDQRPRHWSPRTTSTTSSCGETRSNDGTHPVGSGSHGHAKRRRLARRRPRQIGRSPVRAGESHALVGFATVRASPPSPSWPFRRRTRARCCSTAPAPPLGDREAFWRAKVACVHQKPTVVPERRSWRTIVSPIPPRLLQLKKLRTEAERLL